MLRPVEPVQAPTCLKSVRVFVYSQNQPIADYFAVEEVANFVRRVRIPSLAPIHQIY
jgi:hypothetical protein